MGLVNDGAARPGSPVIAYGDDKSRSAQMPEAELAARIVMVPLPCVRGRISLSTRVAGI